MFFPDRCDFLKCGGKLSFAEVSTLFFLAKRMDLTVLLYGDRDDLPPKRVAYAVMGFNCQKNSKKATYPLKNFENFGISV